MYEHTEDDEDESVTLQPGMVISIRSRHDVVIIDPDKFLTAARRAYLAYNPGADESELAVALADPYCAVDALINCYHTLASDDPELAAGSSEPPTMHGGVGLRPGQRVPDRPDGLSPAGMILSIEFGHHTPLQDYGCFLPSFTELMAEPLKSQESSE
ncbi:hypothetical protein FB565_000344 [Actinoplanes lutulentus]|uniref:Uncharacterized protein n=1 Tax=Actinoplanes lutulentus TaxID=1287878 RepID=A0A327ZL02_9ACTN|nr:hypothetical protein [Actinoplanes lutulentus]MBB2940640.1 hypothetical protein [Actinoplanes lutulentus]RAK42951.1 hypothetical protein B0I29_10181 [Actinoplanes lutulentus]